MRGEDHAPAELEENVFIFVVEHAGKHHIAQSALLRLTPHLRLQRPAPDDHHRQPATLGGIQQNVQPFVVAESADEEEEVIADGFPPVRHPLRIVLHVMLLQTKRYHHRFILIFFQGLAGGHVVGRRGNNAVYAGEESLLQRLVQLHQPFLFHNVRVIGHHRSGVRPRREMQHIHKGKRKMVVDDVVVIFNLLKTL
ncbi:Uncharacterised protein [Klebsiella pneumoniae]|nr:Uncharacterised protein [Klebsiella pneumoniae]SAX51088.1 Uncharacterised protein [Klebsiella pneumoniae]SLO28407.1 Uncharacterised protein [Klebsiella pneumoniae]SVR48082.1 Uncharacterised protein [Klebsiella pneumoniae]